MSSLEEEMMKLIKESPRKFVEFLEKHKVDFEKTAVELDLGRELIQRKYAMDKKSIRAVEFVFWFSYFVEREAQDLIVEPEVGVGGRREAIQLLTDKLHFGDKISVISELYVENPKKDDFISLMRKVQDLRNHVAHGRFDKLKYSDLDLSDAKGQLVILGDLMNAMVNRQKR